MAGLRLALFVEGSTPPPAVRGADPRERIWNEHLCRALGLPRFTLIQPINKKHLVAMDPSNPPMSGASEGLDALIGRTLKSQPFDAAVVAWDLHPQWNANADYCRWDETVRLYRLLAESQSPSFPEAWKLQARQRFEDLSQRPRPGMRSGPPRLGLGTVFALCMEPMFESLLTRDESAARRALGLAGRRIPGWPTGWGPAAERRPDENILKPAILALGRMRPKPEVLRQVRGDLRTNKDGWGELLLRRLLEDPEARSQVLSHPLARRLSELSQGRRR